MGNEGSQMLGVEIKEKCMETTEGWTLHSTDLNEDNEKKLSVFISPCSSENKGSICLLEKYAKNLMLYRHPNILKFVSSWKKNNKIYLATEEVVPLSQVLKNLTPLQICIGLHSILKALVFLHEKALASHNNLCVASVYVTPEGLWKLGGLQYLCRFTDLSLNYLQEARAHRYEKGVAPEEDVAKSSVLQQQPTCIDQYGFGVFVDEILQLKATDDIPGMLEFQQICRKQLQNKEPSVRPKLSTLTEHLFFTHCFIRIHNFLEELPLKTEQEKQSFFRNLSNDLRTFPEELVASQLGNLLLARLVLLDNTAQQSLLPCVFTLKTGSESGLFTKETYGKYIVPKLLQVFCVRDAQIRMLLLTHFQKFCHVFSKEQLKGHILPELLVGIKDTNDQLVSLTLRALADIVPVLGACAVIGGKRGKLFTDGRPKVHRKIARNSSPRHNVRGFDADSIVSFEAPLPERPSPDGGEDHEPSTDEETEVWSDWDIAENSVLESNTEVTGDTVCSIEGRRISLQDPVSTVKKKISGDLQLPDIETLDIKNSSSSGKCKDEVDFFQDMEPVISKPCLLEVSQIATSSLSKFDVNIVTSEEDGWGEDLEDWGDLNDSDSIKNDT